MAKNDEYGALGDRALPRQHPVPRCSQGRAGSPSTPLQKRRALFGIAGFTLVEVLIALALGALVLLPALGVFSTVLKASGRASENCRAHVAAETMAQSAAAGIRVGDEVEDLRVTENPMRVVMRMQRGDDPATIRVTAAADLADGATHTVGMIAFPPLRQDEMAKQEGAVK